MDGFDFRNIYFSDFLEYSIIESQVFLGDMFRSYETWVDFLSLRFIFGNAWNGESWRLFAPEYEYQEAAMVSVNNSFFFCQNMAHVCHQIHIFAAQESFDAMPY